MVTVQEPLTGNGCRSSQMGHVTQCMPYMALYKASLELQLVVMLGAGLDTLVDCLLQCCLFCHGTVWVLLCVMDGGPNACAAQLLPCNGTYMHVGVAFIFVHCHHQASLQLVWATDT